MDKIILVHYLAIGRHGIARAREQMHKYLEQVIKPSRIEQEDILHYVLPIHEGESSIECINPKLVSELEYAKVKDALMKVELKAKDFIGHPMPIELEQEWKEDELGEWTTSGWNEPEGYELSEVTDTDKFDRPTKAIFRYVKREGEAEGRV